MGNHNNDIENETAYFYAVVKNMDLKDSIRQSKIDKHEISLAEVICDYFSDIPNMDKQLSEKNSIEWIELMENDDLRDATCKLSPDEKILLHYVFYEGKTQSEIAEIYSIKHQTISYRLNKIIHKLKKHIFKK